MFKVGDLVVINKNKVTTHIPHIKIDNEVHRIIAVDRMVDMITYVLSGYEKNFFTEDELLDVSKVDDKDKPKKQKMTLEQIESTLGFEIELIESDNKKRK